MVLLPVHDHGCKSSRQVREQKNVQIKSQMALIDIFIPALHQQSTTSPPTSHGHLTALHGQDGLTKSSVKPLEVSNMSTRHQVSRLEKEETDTVNYYKFQSESLFCVPAPSMLSAWQWHICSTQALTHHAMLLELAAAQRSFLGKNGTLTIFSVAYLLAWTMVLPILGIFVVPQWFSMVWTHTLVSQPHASVCPGICWNQKEVWERHWVV